MVGIKSDAGNVRELNEDYASFIEDERFKIYLVADGMGGHNAGEIASKLAVKSIIRYLLEHSEEDENLLFYFIDRHFNQQLHFVEIPRHLPVFGRFQKTQYGGRYERGGHICHVARHCGYLSAEHLFRQSQSRLFADDCVHSCDCGACAVGRNRSAQIHSRTLQCARDLFAADYHQLRGTRRDHSQY